MTTSTTEDNGRNLVLTPQGWIDHAVREALTLEIEARNPDYIGRGLDPWAYVKRS